MNVKPTRALSAAVRGGTTTVAVVLLFGSCSAPPECTFPMVATPMAVPTFEKHTLSTDFLSEGVAVFDVNGDCVPDILTIPYWWAGPDFRARHEVATPTLPPLDPATQFSSVYGVYPQDVDGDGCGDVIVAPHESDPTMFWYQNPRSGSGACGSDAHWVPHEILGTEHIAGTANPIVVPLIAGSPPVLVMSNSNAPDQALGLWTPSPTDPTSPWNFQPIVASPWDGAAPLFLSIGVGDVDHDGLRDILHPTAWFQQTSDRTTWIRHEFPAALLNPLDYTRTCSRMWTYDIDGDGLADVLCSRPHDYGLYWWKQGPAPAGGDPTFTQQTIDLTTVSQMHALRLDDLNGDGVPEIITGKRYFAHLPPTDPSVPTDPGEFDPAILLYYTMGHDASGVTFTPHIIDDDSGAGAQFAVEDLNGDALPDIVTSNKKGVYYFLQLP